MPQKSRSQFQIICDKKGRPQAIRWTRGGTEPITEILDSWRESGAWWEGEEEREVYLIVTSTQKSYELCHGHISKRWEMPRIFD